MKIISAGLAIVYKKSILLGHPTGRRFYGTYSIPKGRTEEGEDIKTAALRETFEETGIKIKKSQINVGPFVEVYKKNKKFWPDGKEVHWYTVYIKDLSEIGLSKTVIDKSKLKPNEEGILEFDWVGFVSFDEADARTAQSMKLIIRKVISIYNKNENLTMEDFMTFEEFNISEANQEDKDLEDIRHFRGSFAQFNDFLKKKMEETNPYKNIKYTHPVEREEVDNSMPYQDFANGTSAVVKHNEKTRRKGNKK